MQPTSNQVHVNRPLTNISVAYMQDDTHFVAGKVFPEIPVDKLSDLYFKYNKEDWFRDEAAPRADGTESAGSGYGLSQDNYNCNVDAFHKDVGDQTRGNADNPLDPDRDATNFVTQRLLLRREKQWVANYFKTGVWGTDKVGGAHGGGGDFDYLSDYTNSDPTTLLDDGKELILKTTGFEANTLVVAFQVFNKMKRHPVIRDYYKYTSSESITAAMIARVLEVENLYVAKAVENTGKEGGAASMNFTHGKNMLLCHVAKTPGVLVPSAGYIFSWKGVSAGMGKTIGVSRFRMQHLKADRIEGEQAFDMKVVGADLGVFYSNAIA